jgi:hypothetical protein
MANRLRPLSGLFPHIARSPEARHGRSRALGGAIGITLAVACTAAWAALFVWAPSGTTAAAIFASAGVLLFIALTARL